MLFDCRPKILHKHCLHFLLGVKMAPRETENNAYAKFWRDKQRTLWYVMVFLEWSIYYSPFQSLLFRSERIQIFHHPILVPSLTVHGTMLLQSHCREEHNLLCLNHSTTSFTSSFDWYDSKTHPRFSSSSSSHSYTIIIIGPSFITRPN